VPKEVVKEVSVEKEVFSSDMLNWNAEISVAPRVNRNACLFSWVHSLGGCRQDIIHRYIYYFDKI
jgi:hypothetical protein